MSRGKRYEEPKLNLKKVFAVIIAFIVLIMFIFMIRGLFARDEEQTRIISKDYFAVFQNNKWGIIDSTGAVVIDPSYEEMMVVPNSKKDVFLCTYDVNYETGEYSTKALNSKNEEIFTQYDQIEPLQVVSGNTQVSYIDNALKVQKDGKYGLIDLDGKELVAPQYADIRALKAGDTSSFIIQNDEGKYGIINSSNQVVLEPNYDGIKDVYTSNYYVVQQDDAEKLIRKDGTDVLTTGFDEITGILKNEENGVIFKQNDKYGIMNLTGEVTLNPTYDDLKEAKTGLFIASQDGKYGVIDSTGAEKLGFTYQSLSYYEKADLYVGEDENFNNSIMNGNFEVKQNGILIDIDEEKGYLQIRQNDENKYYDFSFNEKKESEIFTTRTLFLSKKDDKYGFVDKDGNVVVDYIYDDATSQNNFGYAAVKKDGKWGSIDDKGTVIQEPTYNLDDYLLIDFIGRWHFGRDVNMNYYNQL